MPRRLSRDTSLAASLLDFPWWIGAVIGVTVWFLIGVALRVAGPPRNRDPDLVGGLIGGAILVAASTGLITRGRRRVLLERAVSLEQLKAGSSADFEDLCNQLYRLQGYAVTENKLPTVADGGVDLEVEKAGKRYLVQCKHWWSQPVGVREVRELWGIVHHERADGGILITSSTFSDAAITFERGKDNLILINGRALLAELRKVQTAPLKRASSTASPIVGQNFATALELTPPPECRICHKPMQLVTELRDTTVNDQFWSCSDYPSCKGIRQLRPVLDDGASSGARRAPKKVSLIDAARAGLNR